MSEIKLKSLREIIAESKMVKVEEKKEVSIDEAMKIQDIIKLLSDADSKLKAALKGFDEELYNSASIENDIDEVQSKLLKIINKLKSGNYNK